MIVDTDPQASATLGLGIHPDTPAHSIYHLYVGAVNPEAEKISLSDLIVRSVSGIDLVPSHLDLIGAEPILYQYPDRFKILAHEIAHIKNRYDHIFIDTPPFLGQFVLNGLYAADQIALVFSPDSFALHGYENICLILKDIEEILGKKVSINIAILNRWFVPVSSLSLFDRIGLLLGRKTEEPDVGEELRSRIKGLVQRDIPRIFEVPDSKMVGVSNQRGMPLALSEPEDPAGKAFATIAEVIDQE